MIEIKVQSKGFNNSYDITDQVKNVLPKLNKPSGLAKICVVGSTVGLTLMRYEPGTVKDLFNSLNMVAPMDKTYEHFHTTQDQNGFAHVWSSLLGTNVVIPYKDYTLTCSDTHRIILLDFDLRQANRTIYIDS
ncbi:YjbQ family protein [Priestia filamentosa]|uniref:YjbQ family protein n=1 Tax=Priestia filamentosa TaxID=1402861 RepID=UPI0039825145